MELYLICPICKSNSINSSCLSAVDYISGDSFQVFKCLDCGVGYTYPHPSDMEKYYPNKYRQYNIWVLKTMQIVYRFRIYKWIRNMKPGSALEIGCGDGIVLDTLRRSGWQIFGTERFSQAILTHNIYNLPIFVGGLDAIKKKEIFDLIILFQVLEHLENPIEIIQQCADILKPGGKILIGVPNFASWQATISKENWFHLDVPRHLFHFSLQPIQILLKTKKLNILSVNYEAIEHDPYGWIQSLLNIGSKRKNILTRQLMHLEKLDFTGIVLGIIGIILFFPALILAGISWQMGKGAIMYIECLKSE